LSSWWTGPPNSIDQPISLKGVFVIQSTATTTDIVSSRAVRMFLVIVFAAGFATQLIAVRSG
jgi:hypothetical protein